LGKRKKRKTNTSEKSMPTIEPPSFMKNPYKDTMMGCCHERYKVEPYNCIEVYNILLVVQSSNYQLEAY
jgi:hypothetical protein